VSALLTEELLEKKMPAKTKHKKFWKFYYGTRGIQKGKSTKTDKTDKKLNHLSFQSTEQLKNNTFLTWYRHFPGKMTVSALLTEELLEKKCLQKLNIRNSGSFIEIHSVV
jgi:hypothetical protein